MSSLLVSSVLLSIASVIPVDGSPLGKPVKRQFANSSSKEPAPATSAKDATKTSSAAAKKTSATSTHAESKASSSAPANKTSAVDSNSAVPSGITQSATNMPPTLSPAASSSSGVPTSTSPASSGSSSGGISSAAVGGIAAMAGIVVIGAGAFFLLRRNRRRDQNKKRATVMSVDPFTMGFGSNNGPPPLQTQSSFQQMQSHPMTDTSFPPPMPATVVTAPAPPPSAQQPEPQPLGTYTVISTYTPTLGDELEIHPGDRVEVLVEYDDGWVTGRNVSRGGVKGVFPKHCVDYATSPSQHEPAMLDAAGEQLGRTKRISSIYGAQ